MVHRIPSLPTADQSRQEHSTSKKWFPWIAGLLCASLIHLGFHCGNFQWKDPDLAEGFVVKIEALPPINKNDVAHQLLADAQNERNRLIDRDYEYCIRMIKTKMALSASETNCAVDYVQTRDAIIQRLNNDGFNARHEFLANDRLINVVLPTAADSPK